MKKMNIKNVLVGAAATGAGAIGAGFLNQVAFVKTLNPMVRGGAKVAAGVFLPHLLGKGKNAEIFSKVGAGIISVGMLELANGTIFSKSPISISGLPVIGETNQEYFKAVLHPGIDGAGDGAGDFYN